MGDYNVDTSGRFPIKAWTKGVQVEDVAVEQLRNIAPRMFSYCSGIRKTSLKTPFSRQRRCGFQPWCPPIRKTVLFGTPVSIDPPPCRKFHIIQPRFVLVSGRPMDPSGQRRIRRGWA